MLALATGLSLTADVVPAYAQAKKTVTKKAASGKPTVKPNGPVVLGTTQLPGDFGKLGTTYTVGKSEPVNFTLKSAEYTITPLMVGNNIWVPKADQKLLVLHYTIHNPLPREQRYYWAQMRFTAVDAQDKNQEMIQAVSREGTTESLDVSLKPAQRIEVTTAILVPAEGVVPKLIVEREKGAPVVRYDLRGKAAPLPATIAAAPGVDAPKIVSAVPGAFYTTGVFDMRLDEIAYAAGPLNRQSAGDGKRFLTAIFTLKNRTKQNQRYYWGNFVADLKDADGEKAPYVQALLRATRDESVDSSLAPGEDVRVRFIFPIPNNVTGKTVRVLECKEVQDDDARSFAFDISGLVAK
ncbi:MAG: hypothetical protein H7Z41_09340 [Cytophagales bacterium]|nr:hypothetical protein [Armatimonadota bacterium]